MTRKAIELQRHSNYDLQRVQIPEDDESQSPVLKKALKISRNITSPEQEKKFRPTIFELSYECSRLEEIRLQQMNKNREGKAANRKTREAKEVYAQFQNSFGNLLTSDIYKRRF